MHFTCIMYDFIYRRYSAELCLIHYYEMSLSVRTHMRIFTENSLEKILGTKNHRKIDMKSGEKVISLMYFEFRNNTYVVSLSYRR